MSTSLSTGVVPNEIMTTPAGELRNGAASVNPYVYLLTHLDKVKEFGQFLTSSGIVASAKDNPNKGTVVAMACIVRGIDPLEFDAKYDIISNRVGKKTATMLAEFNAMGGIHVWDKDGTDMQSAKIKLSIGGVVTESEYSVADAARAELCGPDLSMKPGQKFAGGWQKNPANMLRARAASNAIRMAVPTICVGLYTPEELQDMEVETQIRSDPYYPPLQPAAPAMEVQPAPVQPAALPPAPATPTPAFEVGGGPTTEQVQEMTAQAAADPAGGAAVDPTEEARREAVTANNAAAKERQNYIEGMCQELGTDSVDLDQRLQNFDPPGTLETTDCQYLDWVIRMLQPKVDEARAKNPDGGQTSPA